MALTDISGIGSATAEKLKNKGITSKRELAEARKRGDGRIRGFGKRVQDAARKAAIDEFGSFEDPMLGIRVTEENESLVDKTTSEDTTLISDSGKVTRNKPRFQGATLLDLGKQAVEGAGLLSSLGYTPSQQEISDTVVTGKPEGQQQVEDRSKIERRQARRNMAEMGFDIASNFTEASREDVKRANELKQEASPSGGTKTKAQGVKTGFSKTVTKTIIDEEKEMEKDVRVKPREFAAAKRVHNARSPMAKRVDNRREAETVTGDFDKWVEAPSQTDFAGVDTPQKGGQAGDAFGYNDDETDIEARMLPTGDGFRVEEKASDGGGFGRIEENAGQILSAPQEQQRLVLKDLLPSEEEVDELGLEPRGPDQDLFFGNAEGDFL